MFFSQHNNLKFFHSVILTDVYVLDEFGQGVVHPKIIFLELGDEVLNIGESITEYLHQNLR